MKAQFALARELHKCEKHLQPFRFVAYTFGESTMSDQRSQQNTYDTGSSTARARDDLRTASKKKKPKDQRAEGRDKKDVADKADKNAK